MDGGPEYDPLDYYALRIHSCGVFVKSGGVLTYAGGTEYVQYIEREKLGFTLIKEYIKDFIMMETEVYQRDMKVKIHWLFPGQSLDDGLALLYDDALVKRMDEATTDGGVAEIYVEQIEDDGSANGQAEESDWEAELEDKHSGSVSEQADQVVDIAVREVYSKHKGTRFPLINVEVIDTDKAMALLCDGVGSLHVSPVSTCKEKSVLKVTQSPQEKDAYMEKFRQIYGCCQDKSKKIKAKRQLHLAEPVVSTTNNVADPSMPGPSTPQGNAEHHKEVSDEDQSDSDFEPVPDCSSGEDFEAETLRKFARELRRQNRAKKLGDGVRPIISNNKVTVPDDDGGYLEKGYETPYFDLYDDCSYDEESDEEGETVLVRRRSQWPRYDSKADSPKFHLSMVLRGKEQMKKALLKYALKEHVHLIFTNDEHDKVRANCSWPGCKWMIYASRTTKNKWMQVSTFVDEHNCIPRRDNRLVTARVIAEKYGNLIKANPTWKLENIQKTVLEDMLVDVHILKCKWAKKMVLEKVVDSTHGDYSKVFDYQLEILRSNPGSTVAVKLDPDQPDGKHVFLRFYVCFKALKKGFLAGCRRVIGLDGCFFKGACYGQLLCAPGRDANNQMYPVAWAVVEKETGDSWYWFLDLLDKDLKIKDQGEGWVFISDQQKVHIMHFCRHYFSCAYVNCKSCKNNPNIVHNVNDHIVRHGTRKRRADKAAYEAEIAKKSKNVAESSQKGKAPAHVVLQVVKEKKPAGPAAVVKEKKIYGPAVVAKEKKKVALTITGSQSSRPSAQPRSQPSQQPSHCVFNLAAYKAKMMKNGTEGSSGSAKKCVLLYCLCSN